MIIFTLTQLKFYSANLPPSFLEMSLTSPAWQISKNVGNMGLLTLKKHVIRCLIQSHFCAGETEQIEFPGASCTVAYVNRSRLNFVHL